QQRDVAVGEHIVADLELVEYGGDVAPCLEAAGRTGAGDAYAYQQVAALWIDADIPRRLQRSRGGGGAQQKAVGGNGDIAAGGERGARAGGTDLQAGRGDAEQVARVIDLAAVEDNAARRCDAEIVAGRARARNRIGERSGADGQVIARVEAAAHGQRAGRAQADIIRGVSGAAGQVYRRRGKRRVVGVDAARVGQRVAEARASDRPVGARRKRAVGDELATREVVELDGGKREVACAVERAAILEAVERQRVAVGSRGTKHQGAARAVLQVRSRCECRVFRLQVA